MSKPNIVVLMGGPDAERDVSISSGTAVAAALEKNKAFHTTLKLIDTPSTKELLALQADVIFPVLHGPFGEGGPLQRLLERTMIPFVGSGSETSSNAMDKVISKQIAQNIGVPTPTWSVVSDTSCEIHPPLVLKPLDDGSSVDLVICEDAQTVQDTLRELLQTRTKILAETYKEGREITVSVVNGKSLPVIEIIPHTGHYDYAAKYERDDTTYILDPPLQDNRCITWAEEIVDVMHIRDVGRVDFIIDEIGPWFLEVNTMPGFTDHSLLPMAAAHKGWDMTTLCSNLVASALERSTTIRS